MNSAPANLKSTHHLTDDIWNNICPALTSNTKLSSTPQEPCSTKY